MQPGKYPPQNYQIRVEGHLDERWLRWYDGLVTSQCSNGETRISGTFDQAALHGILNRIRDLGLVIISVQRSENKNEEDSERKSS